MEAKELRIGNYILVESKTEYSISDNGLSIERANIYNIMDLFSDNKDFSYHPIPLTEEWLFDFGFELLTDKDKGFRRTLFYMRKPCWTLCKLDIGFGVEFWQGNQLRYVHQLQNLYFALTGEELKLNK